MLSRALVLLVLALPLTASAQVPASAPVDDTYFVYLGSFTAKSSAQAQARRLGGWVLRTDLYRDLTPGYFAVVRGPFRTRVEADSILALVQPQQPDALVRASGPALMPPALGDPALLAAVLGDLTVVASSATDIARGCAPSEPYLTVVVGFMEPLEDGEIASASGYWLIERTGEVVPIRNCPVEDPAVNPPGQ